MFDLGNMCVPIIFAIFIMVLILIAFNRNDNEGFTEGASNLCPKGTYRMQNGYCASKVGKKKVR